MGLSQGQTFVFRSELVVVISFVSVLWVFFVLGFLSEFFLVNHTSFYYNSVLTSFGFQR